MNMAILLKLCTCACVHPEEAIWSPGAEVRGDCKAPHVGTENSILIYFKKGESSS